MSKYFIQNTKIREFLLGTYRIYARNLFWRSGPKILVNSLPKAGTHLVTEVLSQLKMLQNSRLHIVNSQVGNFKINNENNLFFDLKENSLKSIIQDVRPGQFFSSHLPYSLEAENIFKDKHIHQVLVIRDPRDILISRLFYITNLRRHYLHNFLVNNFHTNEERLIALIDGGDIDNWPAGFCPCDDLLRMFSKWLLNKDTYIVRFEKLIQPNKENVVYELNSLIRFLKLNISEDKLATVASASIGKPTPTFRKGSSGEWKEYFSAKVNKKYNEKIAEEAFKFGYE